MKPVMLQNLLDKVLDRSFQQQQQQQQMPQQPQSQQQQQLMRAAGPAPARSDHGNSGSDAFAGHMKNDLATSVAAAAAVAESLDHHHRQQQQQLALLRSSGQRLAAEHAQNAKALQQQHHYLQQQAAAVQQQQQQQAAAAAAATAAAAAFSHPALNSRTSGGEPGVRSSSYGVGGPQLPQQMQQRQQQQLMPGLGPQHALSAAHHLATTAPVLATIHQAGMPAAFGYDQLVAARQPSPRGSIVTGVTQPQSMPSLVSPSGTQQQQQQQPYSLRRSPAGPPSEMPSPRQASSSRATSRSPAQFVHGSASDVSLDHPHRSPSMAAAAAWHHQQQQQQRRPADSREPPAVSQPSHTTTEPVMRVSYEQRTPPGYGTLPIGAHGPSGEMFLLSPHQQQQQQRGPHHPPDSLVRLQPVGTGSGPADALRVTSSPPPSSIARPPGSAAFATLPRPNAFKNFNVANGVLGTLPPGAPAGLGSHAQPGSAQQQQRLGLPGQSQGLRPFGGLSQDGVAGYSGATVDETLYRRRMEIDGHAPPSWHRPERIDDSTGPATAAAAAAGAIASGATPAKSPACVMLPGGGSGGCSDGSAPPAHSPTASSALHRQQPTGRQRLSASASPSPTSSVGAAIADVSGQQQQPPPLFLHPSSPAAMTAMQQQQHQQQLLLMHGGTAHFAAPYAVAMQRQPQLQQPSQHAAATIGRRLPGSGTSAVEVGVPLHRQQPQAMATAASVAELALQQPRSSPASPTTSGSLYPHSSLALHAPTRHFGGAAAAAAAATDAVSSDVGSSTSGASATAVAASSSPRGLIQQHQQQRHRTTDEVQPLDLSARPAARPSPSAASRSTPDGDSETSQIPSDAQSYGIRGSGFGDDQPLDLTMTKPPRQPRSLGRADHDSTPLLLSSTMPEKDSRAHVPRLVEGSCPPVDVNRLAAPPGMLLSAHGDRSATALYSGGRLATSSDAADAIPPGLSLVTQPSLRRPATALTSYAPGLLPGEAAIPILHRNHTATARYGSGVLVSHDTHPVVLEAVAASSATVRGSTQPPQPPQLSNAAAATAAAAATVATCSVGFGAASGGGGAACVPAPGNSDPTPAILDGLGSSGLAAASSRDAPLSTNAGLSPLGQNQPQPALSSVTSLIGSHPLSDILFLHCTRCQSSYGSVHGFRKHFRNAHGHNPSADDVQVQSISATRELVRRQRDGAAGSCGSDGPQQQPQLPPPGAPSIDAKQLPVAFGARVGGATQHASDQQSLAVAHEQAANSNRGLSWEEEGVASSGYAIGSRNNASSSRGSGSGNLLATEQRHRQSVNGSDPAHQSPFLVHQQQQRIGSDVLSADKFCLHCVYCGRQYPSTESVAFEDHVLQHERQLSGGGGMGSTQQQQIGGGMGSTQQQQIGGGAGSTQQQQIGGGAGSAQLMHHAQLQQQHRDVHTYRCYYCGERAADAGALREHLLQHDDLMHFVCAHCAVAYPTAAAAGEHASECHRHQGLLRYSSTSSTASRSPPGEEVPPSAECDSISSDSGSGGGRPADDSEQSRLTIARGPQPLNNGLALHARSRPDASPLCAGSPQPYSHDVHGTSKQQLQAAARVCRPGEPHWDAAVAASATPGQQSPSAAVSGRSPDTSVASQSPSPQPSRRDPAAEATEVHAPTDSDGISAFGTVASQKNSIAGSRRSRAPYTLAQHIEAAVIRELSKANDGLDDATGSSRAEAVVRAAAGIELDQLLHQQSTGSAIAAAAETGSSTCQPASLALYSSPGSTTVNLMAILDRVVEHGLRSFESSCTSPAAVADGVGGGSAHADAVALTREMVVVAAEERNSAGAAGSRGAVHLASSALWGPNVANGHREASPEHFASRFAPQTTVAGSESSGSYGGGGSDREASENGRLDLTTSAGKTVGRSSSYETSNGPTFSTGSTERADDSEDEASAADGTPTEPATDSSQHSPSRDTEQIADGVEQTVSTDCDGLASPCVQHLTQNSAVQRQDAPTAGGASLCPTDESSARSRGQWAAGAAALSEGGSSPSSVVDRQNDLTSLPLRSARSLSNVMHGHAGSNTSGVDDSNCRSDGQLPPSSDAPAVSTEKEDRLNCASTAAVDTEPVKVEASPPTTTVGATTLKNALAASSLAENGSNEDDDDMAESQLGERLLIDEERCSDDVDHSGAGNENVEGPMGTAASAAAIASAGGASASAADADDSLPPAPKIARIAVPE